MTHPTRLLAALLLTFAPPAIAQDAAPDAAATGPDCTCDSTLTVILGDDDDGDDHPASGGWGAPTWTWMPTADGTATLDGGRGAWVIDHKWAIGGHGQGGQGLDGGRIHYGGLFVDRIIAPEKPVHLVLTGAWGMGSMRAAPVTRTTPSTGLVDSGATTTTTRAQPQGIQVFQGGIYAEAAPLRWVRVAAGPVWRTVARGETAPFEIVEHAVGAEVLVKFGRF